MTYAPPPDVSSRYGAPHGRPSRNPAHDEGGRFYLRRVRLDAGGYDAGGAYWGLGAPIYHYQSAEYPDVEGYIRAMSRAAAKISVGEMCDGARFFR